MSDIKADLKKTAADAKAEVHGAIGSFALKTFLLGLSAGLGFGLLIAHFARLV